METLFSKFPTIAKFVSLKSSNSLSVESKTTVRLLPVAVAGTGGADVADEEAGFGVPWGFPTMEMSRSTLANDLLSDAPR